MRRAMANVEKFYPVVGIIENMNMTLKVLEKTMPEYFEGASEIYFSHSFLSENLHKTKNKKLVSENSINIIRKNFTHEIEFYEFCKQRLQLQYDQYIN